MSTIGLVKKEKALRASLSREWVAAKGSHGSKKRSENRHKILREAQDDPSGFGGYEARRFLCRKEALHHTRNDHYNEDYFLILELRILLNLKLSL